MYKLAPPESFNLEELGPDYMLLLEEALAAANRGEDSYNGQRPFNGQDGVTAVGVCFVGPPLPGGYLEIQLGSYRGGADSFRVWASILAYRED